MTANRKITVGKAMSVDEQAHTLTAVMSTRSVDRDGDIVEPKGMRMENFQSNPVVLWAHDKKAPPIGRVKEVYVSDDSVLGNIEFDRDDPFAMMIFNKYAKGFLNAWSIGFAPEAKTVETISDGDGQVTGYHFKEAELLELSAVPVPANPQALVREMKDVDAGLAKRFVDGLEDDALKREIEKVFTKDDHNDEVAEVEPNWGSVDKSALPEVAFVWEAPDTDAEKKGTWRFPHHWIEDASNKNGLGVWTTGKMYLSESGLQAAWAAAMGARTGARAPASVINHLQKHRIALGINEQARGKLYSLEHSADGALLRTEKDFIEITDDYAAGDLFEESGMKLAENVFKKSIEERGDKLPTSYAIGEAFKMVIDFEAIQVNDGIVKEAKILEVRITVPKPAEKAELPPEEEEASLASKEAAGEEGNDVTEPVDVKSFVDDLDVELRGYAAKIASL